ncbi:biotin synthase BioB [Candidatus Albibeggiatoa sp. nov. NOAA]|uniref:biotin synthase BioB n=1 Tax=Candidatus Albibeggiatoa sp. nov. NOAA TaxID=3162724 RepID=UPI0032F5C138|nr:biotin synthase BioB [Thiotrichaceae bacterium]
MTQTTYPIRHDWSLDEVLALFSLPLNDLIYQAQTAHRSYFNPNEVQLSTLLNIKTGNCPEDCAYCPQSVHFKTTIEPDKLMPTEEVQAAARKAKEHGASRFCMGAAWRKPRGKAFEQVIDIIKTVKSEGLEACMTLGMLDEEQTKQLKEAGLDYYNHNLDTSENFYPEIITTRTYKDRLDTLARVQQADIKVCAGGIIGMGETLQDRAEMLQTLANLPKHPDSIPINQLVRVEGTPLEQVEPIDSFDMVRCLAVTRILMPASYVRLSAGRSEMSDETQALCFLAGANSIFYGDKLLTTENPSANHDLQLLDRLGIQAV